MTLRYIISPGDANEKVLTEDDIINHNPVRTHTGLADLSATLVEDRSLDEYVQRQDRLNVEVDGNVVWAGFAIQLSHNIGEGRSRLRADGIAKRLKETRPDYDSLGGSLTYTSISLENAIDDYWSRTPFGGYSVTPQSTETVATDELTQSLDTNSEWNNAVTIGSNQPIAVQNNQLELLQSLFFAEGENFDRGTDGFDSGSGDTNISNNDYASLSRGPNVTGGPDEIEFDFEVNYTIPEANSFVEVRQATDPDGAPAFQVEIEDPDGNTTLIEENSAVGAALSTDFSWDTLPSFGSPTNLDGVPELTPGTWTLRVTVTDSDSSADTYQYWLDCVALYDDRYTYNFDETTDANDALAGPELYPESEQLVFDDVEVDYNLTGARIDSSWTNTTGTQAISLSNDDGNTYLTTNNSQTADVSFSGPGRTLTQRVTLSRYDTGATTTPTSGDAGQQIDTWDAFTDGNNLVVIDDLELSRNHFENLQQLHQYGTNWQWTIEHDDSEIADMTVISYQEGDETRSKPSSFADPISESAEVQTEAYFNSIYLQGKLDESGNRPVAELKDQTRISSDGREISPGVLRDTKIRTEAGALYRARGLLDTALSNNDLVGTKTLPSDTLINPGYQYPVDFGQGDVDKTLEEVSLSESPTNVNLRARFSTPRSDLSSQIEDLKRRNRDVEDNV